MSGEGVNDFYSLNLVTETEARLLTLQFLRSRDSRGATQDEIQTLLQEFNAAKGVITAWDCVLEGKVNVDLEDNEVVFKSLNATTDGGGSQGSSDA
jgi:hypothetical protein